MNLKLLTLNTHSLHGDESEIKRKMKDICEFLADERPNIVAMQEINQCASASYADTDHTEGYYRAATCECPVPLKKGNFAVELAWNMCRRGVAYHFTYLPVKRGYGIFDEGLAVFSLSPIRSSCGFYISRGDDFSDHNTRMAQLVEIKESDLIVCNLHTSRYDHDPDPFYDQWKRLRKRLPQKNNMFIMGDLNCPAEVRGEGYDRVCESGFFDSYRIADQRLGGVETTEELIDGWKDGVRCGRIDYVFTSFYPMAQSIVYSRVFDGERGEKVSDHFGVMVEYKGLEVER